MKLFSVCVLLALAAAIKAHKEILMPIVTQCKASVGASDDEVGQMMATSMAETPKQKCMFLCIMTAVGVIKGGKLQKEGTMTLAKIMTDGNPEKLKAAEDIFNECSSIGDPNDCEAADKIQICLQIVGSRKGIIIRF